MLVSIPEWPLGSWNVTEGCYRAEFHLGINTIGQSRTGFIMVHSAYKAPHQCRWKFRRSSCQIIFIGLHCASYPKEEHSDIRRQVDCVSNRQLSWWSYLIRTKSSLNWKRIWLEYIKWSNHPTRCWETLYIKKACGLVSEGHSLPTAAQRHNFISICSWRSTTQDLMKLPLAVTAFWC